MAAKGELPVHFLGTEELTTVGGCVTVTVLVTNGLAFAFGWRHRYVGLLVAMLTALLGVVARGNATALDWILAIPNGFLVFAGATGVASMTALPSMRSVGPEETVSPDRRGKKFFRAWF